MTDYLGAALLGVRRVINNQPADEELAESVMNAVLDAQAKTLGTQGWWIDLDGHGELTVWMPNPGYQNSPRAVITER